MIISPVQSDAPIMSSSLSQNPFNALAPTAKAWPFEEARKILARIQKRKGAEDKPVLFETGYGPSGLPHIGTFGEVSRTLMVKYAFEILTKGEVPTHLICFSDDLDGLRKVPDNVPEQEMLTQYLEMPLTKVPDPFKTHESFGAHNNARLQAFLDRFGFDYSFMSATEAYRSGRFDQTLLTMLKAYDKVMAIILPTLGPDRQASYSPFLPLCPRTGKVLQVPMIARDVEAGTVTYKDPETGEDVTVPVTGGHVKCQWKADWALRWTAMGVDYEMAGKDLIESVKLSGRICKALGGQPPEGFNYELFLDEKGQKISKSKGNGLTIEEWLTYANMESLSLYMFQKPKTAKRLHFDVIPKAVDEYFSFLQAYQRQTPEQQLANPVWFIHQGNPPDHTLPIGFSMLLNLASAANAENADVLWGFIQSYAPDLQKGEMKHFDALVDKAVVYYHDHVKPHKRFRPADSQEQKALQALLEAFETLPENSSAEEIQSAVYAVGRDYFPNHDKKGPDGQPGVLQDWFAALYQILLGQEKGPRFGSFAALYGLNKTMTLIKTALE
jgi:lysyl-tRNA synthetase class 1